MYCLIILDNGDPTHTFQSLLSHKSKPPRWPSMILIPVWAPCTSPPTLIRAGPVHPVEYGGNYSLWFLKLGHERDFHFHLDLLDHLLWGKLQPCCKGNPCWGSRGEKTAHYTNLPVHMREQPRNWVLQPQASFQMITANQLFNLTWWETQSQNHLTKLFLNSWQNPREAKYHYCCFKPLCFMKICYIAIGNDRYANDTF